MFEWILFGFMCYSLGLITGPLFLFVCFKLAMRVLRRAQRR
jgi:hypothetical protein